MMEYTSIYYDTKSNKVGILIPTSEQDYNEKTGVVRFFFSNKDMPANNWQTLDSDFIYIGESPTAEKFFVFAVLQMLEGNPHNKKMQEFWRKNGIEV